MLLASDHGTQTFGVTDNPLILLEHFAWVTVGNVPNMHISEDGGPYHCQENNSNLCSMDIYMPSFSASAAKVQGQFLTGGIELSNSNRYSLWNLENASDGERVMRMKAYSSVHGTCLAEARIIMDREPPYGTMRINDGRPATKRRDVWLDVVAHDDGIGLDAFRVWNEGQAKTGWMRPVSWNQWVTDIVGNRFTLPVRSAVFMYAHELTEGEGPKTVCIELRDSLTLGNQFMPRTTTLCDSIYYDTSPPSGSVVIAGGAEFINTLSVALTVTASACADAQYVKNEDEVFTGEGANEVGSRSHLLSPGSGLKTVTMRLEDEVGNTFDTSASIFVDLQSPTGTLQIAERADHTSAAVELTISARDWDPAQGPQPDWVSGVEAMRFKNDNEETWSVWEPYATSKSWNLSTAGITRQGGYTRQVVVQFIDRAGNIGMADASTFLIVDSTPPSGFITVNSNALYTTSPSATITIGVNDVGSGVKSMRFRNESTPEWTAWESFARTKSWTLSPGDGPKIVYAEFMDHAGNISAEISDGIVLDLLPPTGSISINNGAAGTTTSTVTLNLTASDASSGVAGMRFRNCSSTEWSSWVPYDTIHHFWGLSAGTGSKTVYAQFIDRAGHIAGLDNDIFATIVLTEPPSGTIQLNGGNLYTNSLHVTATIVASSSATQMCVYPSGQPCVFEPVASTKPVSLLMANTLNTVRVRFRDAHGNISLEQIDSIYHDDRPPYLTDRLRINGGSPAWVSSHTVTLSIAGTDERGVAAMRFSNGCTDWSDWEPYASTREWTLSPGGGEKLVCVEVLDVAGNKSTCNHHSGHDLCWNITKPDVYPPSCNIAIQHSPGLVTSRAVVLTVSASDIPAGAVEIRFRDGGEFGPWRSTSSTMIYHLTSPEGRVKIDAECRDRVGNVSDANSTASTILDLTAPEGSITINGGATHTRSPRVELALPAFDQWYVVENRISNDGISWPLFPYINPRFWDLSPGDGPKTVHVRFRDTAGNLSAIVSDTIILDTTPPWGTLVINDWAEFTNVADVSLTITASDNISSALQVRVRDENLPYPDWSPLDGQATVKLTGGDGERTVYAEIRDEAGNVVELTDNIILDTHPPVGTVVIDDGAQYANDYFVTLTLSAFDDVSGVVRMRAGNEEGTWGEWVPYAESMLWALSLFDEPKTVHVAFEDEAGNVYTADSTIILDRTPPEVSVIIEDGSACIGTHTVTLAIDGTDALSGVDMMRLSNDGVTWTDWQAPVSLLEWELSPGDGERLVALELRDMAGNVAQSIASTFVDTTAPSGSLELDSGSACSSTEEVMLVIAAEDAGCGGLSMRFSNNDDDWSQWIALSPLHAWTLPQGEAHRTVLGQIRDLAGNVTDVSVDVVVDRSPPTGSLLINGGSDTVTGSDVVLTLDASDACGVESMRLRNGDGAWSAWVPYAPSLDWALDPGLGLRSVGVQYRDPLQFVSDELTATILVVHPCSVDQECVSGFCADGYCCDMACDGVCERCDLPGHIGSCTAIAAGLDPDNECIGDDPICGGVCDGARACAIPDASVQCRPPSCADGLLTHAHVCDPALGQCAPQGQEFCSGFGCDSTGQACLSFCEYDEECAPGYTCDVTEGKCDGGLPGGSECVLADQCESGICAGGNCCTGACDDTDPICGGWCSDTGECVYSTTAVDCGLCKTCDGRGACLGTPLDDTDCPTVDCSALDDTCAIFSAIDSNRCRSFGVCKEAPQDCMSFTAANAGTPCDDSSCETGAETRWTCDGQGACLHSTVSCAPYVCEDATVCKIACASDSDCDMGRICDPVTASCGWLLGDACLNDEQCQSGYCTDGVCCESRCQLCERCSADGICVAVVAGTDLNEDCAGTGTCGGTCDGDGACSFPGLDTVCGLCAVCDGLGACAGVPEDDEECGVIACSAFSTDCRVYKDMEAARCRDAGECIVPSVLDCSSSVEDVHDGAPCSCDGTDQGECSAGECICLDPAPWDDSEGCGCTTGTGRPEHVALLFLAMVALLARRRRSKLVFHARPLQGWILKGPLSL